MFAAIKWNSRHSAREWVMMTVASVGQLRQHAIQQSGKRKQRQPFWKRFDDTHHWDSTAEEWVPNRDH